MLPLLGYDNFSDGNMKYPVWKKFQQASENSSEIRRKIASYSFIYRDRTLCFLNEMTTRKMRYSNGPPLEKLQNPICESLNKLKTQVS